MARKGKGKDQETDALLEGAAEALMGAKERGYSAAFLSSAVARARRRGWNGTHEDAMRILAGVGVVHIGKWITFHARADRCPMCEARAGGAAPKGADPKEVFGL